jgi:hypothetical protein
MIIGYTLSYILYYFILEMDTLKYIICYLILKYNNLK